MHCSKLSVAHNLYLDGNYWLSHGSTDDHVSRIMDIGYQVDDVDRCWEHRVGYDSHREVAGIVMFNVPSSALEWYTC